MGNLFLFSIFMILIFARPFICSPALPLIDLIYSSCLMTTCLLWLKNKVKSLKTNTCLVYIFLFLIAIIISSLFSANQPNSLAEIYKYICAFLAFFTVYSFKKDHQAVTILILILSAAAVSLYAIIWLIYGSASFIQYLTRYNISYDFAYELLSRKRAFIPFLLPTALAGYLITGLPLAMVYLLKNYDSKRPLKNSFLIIPVILIASCLFLTKSIGAVLSLLIALLIVSLIKNANSRKFLALSILSLGLGLVLILLIRSYNAAYFTTPLFSFKQRIKYWHNALGVISSHPFLGVGLGNLPFKGAKFAHNFYFQLWAETGILGIAAFLGIVYQTLKASFSKALLQDKICLGLSIANLAFLIHNLIDFTLFLPEVALQWWIIIALLTALNAKSLKAAS